MRRVILGAFAALFSCCLLAQNIKPNVTLKLYPEGQAVDKGIVENGVAVTLGPCEDNELSGAVEMSGDGNMGNISDPYIDIYLPKNGIYSYQCQSASVSLSEVDGLGETRLLQENMSLSGRIGD